ncbi:hypothetical protein DOY81_012911 [Sarcophaga bullata]|nr:hypothetical protein DOY81_012911 [Sarcophaga bullata]
MIKAKPLVVKDYIIVASYAEKYNVVAYDLKTLALKWHVKFGTKGIFSSPVYISDEFVLLCNLDGSYGLIEIENGSLKWQEKLDSPIFATAGTIKTPTEQILLVLAEVKGQVTICKADNGEKVTSFQTEGNIFSSFQLYKQDAQNILIIFGCHDKNVYCLSFEIAMQKLNLIWKYFMHAPVFSTPMHIANSYLLCCSTQGMMTLLGVTNAELIATHDLNAEVFSTPICLNDKFVYLGSRDNNLYAFELV